MDNKDFNNSNTGNSSDPNGTNFSQNTPYGSMNQPDQSQQNQTNPNNFDGSQANSFNGANGTNGQFQNSQPPYYNVQPNNQPQGNNLQQYQDYTGGGNFYGNGNSTPPPKKKSNFTKVVAVVCVAAILGGLTLGIGITCGQAIMSGRQQVASEGNNFFTTSNDNNNIDSNSGNAASPETTPGAEEVNKSFASAIQKAENSVVSINVDATQMGNFGKSYDVVAAGSGIIFSEDDKNVYVVTNEHVIDGANSVTISLDDQTQVPAKLVGDDYFNDIAVISVAKSDLQSSGVTNYQVATFANSDNVQVGDVVIAIGNALGEGKTTTSGMVSALNKTITVDDKTLTVIQTDAAINPGNSGGALIDTDGEVIGMNTAKIVSAEGMGYAIPSNTLMDIANSLMTNGSVARPSLGISGETINDQMASMFGIKPGVLVVGVEPNSAAAQAGIKKNDVIVGVGDQAVTSIEDLQTIIQSSPINQPITIYLYRNGVVPMTVNVTLQDQNANTNF